MEITASLVKELREKTGVGMMDCKKALDHAKGNFEEAVKYLREKGLATASKKSDRSATEGKVFTQVSASGNEAVILELFCETDFVANNTDFQGVGQAISATILQNHFSNLDQLKTVSVSGKSFDEYISEAILRLGENIGVKRFDRGETSGLFASYVHSNGKIGVLVEFSQAIAADLGKDIAMHIAASNPLCVSIEQVPQEEVQRESDIIKTQALNEGKPEAILDKIVAGRLKKYYQENCLLEQDFVKDPEKTIKALLPAGSTINRFWRYAL